MNSLAFIDPVEVHPAGLWPSIGKLLLLRVHIAYNTFKRSKLRNKIFWCFLAVVAVALMVGLFILSSKILGWLHMPALAELINPETIITAIPTLILTTAFMLTVMTNFGVLLQSLYLSRDMDFLVTSPLPMRAVFLSKLLEAILPNFAIFCAFSLPFMFGLGASNHYTFIYYPLVVLLLLMLTLSAGGLASILVMVVARVIPARRVAEVLGVLGAFVSIMCGQSGNIIQALGVNRQDVGQALGAISQLNSPWLPLAWAGRGLTAVGRADWLTGLGLTFLSLALAGAVFAGTLALSEQLYYTGWASLQGSVRKKRAENHRPVEARGTKRLWTRISDAVAGIFPAPVRGMMVKDFLLLTRDPRNVSQLITPLILGVVMLFTTRGGGENTADKLTELGVQHLEIYALIFLTIFVGWLLMLNIGSNSFSMEGKNYWLLKTSPIKPSHMMQAKYLFSYLPVVAFCLVFLLASFLIQGGDLAFFPFCAGVIVLSMAGATGITVAYGAVGANLTWDRPQKRQLRGSAGCLVFIMVVLFLGVDMALFLAPSALFQIFTGDTPQFVYWLEMALGGAAALVAVILPLNAAMPKLATLGEE